MLQAAPHWRNIDFISDLHLQASEPQTFAAWQSYMHGTRADAVFVLGDLFEVWVGDDAALETPQGTRGFEHECAQVLRSTAQRIPVFFMHGNRDFLVGPAFMAQCNTTLLADPTVLAFGGQRWLLSHGDELCLADTDYLKFRAIVRSEAWQRDFLAKPLPQRKAIARDLRAQSEARKHAVAQAMAPTTAPTAAPTIAQIKGSPAANQLALAYADVDTAAATAWLHRAQARCMIHGHTHRPADHVLNQTPGHTLHRVVLSDWDLGAQPPRAEALRLSLEARAGKNFNEAEIHKNGPERSLKSVQNLPVSIMRMRLVDETKLPQEEDHEPH